MSQQHEQHLIACLALAPSWCDRVRERVHSSEFAERDLGRLYDALLTLHDAQRPIGDLRLLLPELVRCGLPESVTRPDFWLTLMADPPLASSAPHYAAEIREDAQRRRLLALAERITSDVDARRQPLDIAAQLDAEIASLGLTEERNPPERIGPLLARVCSDLASDERPRGPGVMTGIAAFDEVTGGWHPGDLVILAARPGVGKTSLATQVALYLATRHRLAGVVSLEMEATQIVLRLVSAWLNIDIRALRSREIEPSNRAKLRDLASEYGDSDMPLDIWSPPTTTLSGIRGYAKRLALQGDLALLVVDYLQLVRPRDYRAPREQQVAEASRGLKAIAKELAVPVLCLSQMNRDAEKTGRAPRLSDLRESGGIEQDADSVVFIHQAEQHTAEPQLIIAKQRFGGTGSITVHFDGARTTFTDPPASSYANYDRELGAYERDDF